MSGSGETLGVEVLIEEFLIRDWHTFSLGPDHRYLRLCGPFCLSLPLNADIVVDSSASEVDMGAVALGGLKGWSEG